MGSIWSHAYRNAFVSQALGEIVQKFEELDGHGIRAFLGRQEKNPRVRKLL